MSGIFDNILLEFTHSNNNIIQHFLHENSFLGVNHLVVSIFKSPVPFEVSKVESSVVLEPLIISAFECDLNKVNSTPLSFLFSSSGKFSS